MYQRHPAPLPAGMRHNSDAQAIAQYALPYQCHVVAALEAPHSQPKQVKGKALLLTPCPDQKPKSLMHQLHKHQQRALLEALEEDLAPYPQTLLTKTSSRLAFPE